MKKLISFLLICFIYNSLVFFGKKKCVAASNINAAVFKLYHDCDLKNFISSDVFEKSYTGYLKYKPAKPILVICDFSKPSNEKRFFIINLEQKKIIYSALVAHGKNSGELYAQSFSNDPQSHKSCKGFLKICQLIFSPKHGTAMLL